MYTQVMNEPWLNKSLSKTPMQIEILTNVRRFDLKQELLELYQKVYEHKMHENKIARFKSELVLRANRFVSLL